MQISHLRGHGNLKYSGSAEERELLLKPTYKGRFAQKYCRKQKVQCKKTRLMNAKRNCHLGGGRRKKMSQRYYLKEILRNEL